MNLIGVFLVCLGPALILGYQDSYDVIQERAEKVYHDDSVLDLTCGVYKSNRTTNALSLSFNYKQALTDHDMAFITGYKWLSNEYRLDIIQFQDTIKNIMHIKYFDIGRLLRNYTTPPAVWPIKLGVTYRMTNWIPTSTEFPPGVPEGRWRILLNFTKADRTPFVALFWYFKIQYKVKFFEFEGSRSTRRPRRH